MCLPIPPHRLMVFFHFLWVVLYRMKRDLSTCFCRVMCFDFYRVIYFDCRTYAIPKAVVGIKQRTDIVGILPDSLSRSFRMAIRSFRGDFYELRLIRDRCVFAATSEGIRFLRKDGVLTAYPAEDSSIVTADELEEIVQRAVGYSAFAHEEELRQSFLTRGDGIRIGIAFSGGAGSLHIGKVNSLNIRFPVADTSVPDGVLAGLLEGLKGGLLIAGAPNTGKTTLLRSCCRFLGSGKDGRFRKVCAIDERMELAGTNDAFDLGICTDVIAGRKKHEAILTALRLLSPEVIVCDEIGSASETESILEGLNSGVLFIASIHARDLGQLLRRKQFRLLFEENVFDRIAVLDPLDKGKILNVYSYEEVADEIHRSGVAFLHGGPDGVLCQSAETSAR